jgi:hypothetical protein
MGEEGVACDDARRDNVPRHWGEALEAGALSREEGEEEGAARLCRTGWTKTPRRSWEGRRRSLFLCCRIDTGGSMGLGGARRAAAIQGVRRGGGGGGGRGGKGRR